MTEERVMVRTAYLERIEASNEKLKAANALLKDENESLRELLRPIVEKFAGVLVQERLGDGQIVGSHTLSICDSHLRACCAALGIEVEK